jgi:2-phospho-L-lactate guanylyltransferase
MQGTVATFEGDTGAGTAVLDDGTRVAFDAAAFAAGGLRHLRTDERDRIVRVTLVTMA